MSASVSGALHLRLEQQRHWEQAVAVQDGQQPAVDPDQYRLTELRKNERVYEGASGPFYKKIVAGSWQIRTESDIYYI